MTIKVGINGYGRIGRNVLRALYEGAHVDKIKIVAINDLGDAKTNAHLTRYDTVHGRFHGDVQVDGDVMTVNGDRIRVFAQRDPSKLPRGRVGGRLCVGMHRIIHEQGEGRGTSRSGGQKGADLGAGRSRCRRHGGLRRQPRRPQSESDRGLKRLVYH
jgi:hypothetical protein